MRHGYTNSTEHSGSTVTKIYAGPDAEARRLVEHHALTGLAGMFPVPDVVAGDPGRLVTRFVRGRHGQDLVDDGLGGEVLGVPRAPCRALGIGAGSARWGHRGRPDSPNRPAFAAPTDPDAARHQPDQVRDPERMPRYLFVPCDTDPCS